jgi:ABC-type transport system involved in multi-copper enzyme maturation permease subunit
MANPVLALDLRLAGRRLTSIRFSSVYAGWLLVQLGVLGCVCFDWPVKRPASWQLGEVIEVYLACFLLQHFFLLLIAVPAYLAGAITDEKAKGTLLLLLTAYVSPWEVVTGKLLARLIQVGTLTLVGLPLFCFVGAYFGYLTWTTLLGVVLLTLALLFAVGAVSVWVSVISTQARTAALRLYVGLAATILTGWWLVQYGLPFLIKRVAVYPEIADRLTQVGSLLRCFDPLYVLGPSWGLADEAEFWRRFQVVGIGCAIVGATFLTMAVWQLRPHAIRYLEGVSSRQRKGPKRHPVEDDPVCWRERLAGKKVLHWVGALIFAIAATEACRWILQKKEFWYFAALWGAGGVLLSLPLSIRASGAITGERDRQTWGTLLISPLETWEIIIDKRWGVLQSFFPYYLAFLVPALTLPWVLGTRALLLTAAMLLLWTTVLFFMASTGVWCSAFSSSSWRSLVATVARGYGYFLGLLTLVALIHLGLACVLSPVAGILANVMGVTSVPEDLILGLVIITSLYLSWRHYKSANDRLWLAQTWIDTRERYGRTFTRSLTRALMNAKQRQEERRKAAELAAMTRRRVPDDPPRYSS